MFLQDTVHNRKLHSFLEAIHTPVNVPEHMCEHTEDTLGALRPQNIRSSQLQVAHTHSSSGPCFLSYLHHTCSPRICNLVCWAFWAVHMASIPRHNYRFCSCKPLEYCCSSRSWSPCHSCRHYSHTPHMYSLRFHTCQGVHKGRLDDRLCSRKRHIHTHVSMFAQATLPQPQPLQAQSIHEHLGLSHLGYARLRNYTRPKSSPGLGALATAKACAVHTFSTWVAAAFGWWRQLPLPITLADFAVPSTTHALLATVAVTAATLHTCATCIAAIGHCGRLALLTACADIAVASGTHARVCLGLRYLTAATAFASAVHACAACVAAPGHCRRLTFLATLADFAVASHTHAIFCLHGPEQFVNFKKP